MKRNYTENDFTDFNIKDLEQRIAYHEAGHATAIYLYNKYKQLPPIFFQIRLKNNLQNPLNTRVDLSNTIAAKVEGGYLIENLSLSFIASQKEMTAEEKQEYYTALEADIVNLLTGSIAEAYYLAGRDGEFLNAQMLNRHALSRYGSDSDLHRIDDYLKYFSPCLLQREKQLTSLLNIAFEFITHFKIWKAIAAVADLILTANKKTIRCEEVFEVIDLSLSTHSNQSVI